ncbi:MAG: type VI secretion protein IcmF/TssM N-terminal domain-containing protein [Candidatus Bipolaricaulia bacterium]
MPYILVAIGILVVLILARLFVVLWAKKRVSAPSEASEGSSSGVASWKEDAEEESLAGIRESFREAMRQLRRLMRKRGYHFDWFLRLTGHSYRYELPWFALLGEEGSGKTTLLENLRLETPVSPLRSDEDAPPRQKGCNWWFYNQALVIDVPGKYLYRSDGKTSDQGWSSILSQLRKYRSRQPLNGIVLTIPCTDLVGEAALSTADIETKAARLHNRLRDLQRKLGLRLPVYVVLTKCDAVPGFEAFCEEIPDERTDDMLGWSNPHSVDAAYTNDWVEDAFEVLYEDLHYAQIRALGDDIQTENRDEFFLFPDLLDEVKERLSTYLEELFRQSAYHEGFMLRGIYLTGDRETGAGEQVQGQAEQAPSPAFLADLFRSKIFEEGKLARPVAAAQSWQQRATWAVQGGIVALALLGVFGLWYAGNDLSEERSALVPILQNAQNSIEQVNQWQETAGQSGGASAGQKLAFKKLATSLLQRTGRATSTDLTSLLIPASWVGSVEEQIDEAIATAYDKVILRSMRSVLRLRAERLVTGDLRSGRSAAAAADTLTLEAMPSYQAWSGYTQDLSALERAAQRYNGLATRPNLNHFGRLAKYLFDVQIQATLDRSPDVYRDALKSVRSDSVLLRRYRSPATDKMRRYAQQFNDALPRRYGVIERLQRLADQIDRLGTVSVGTNLSSAGEEKELRSVRAGITKVEAILKDPESRWLTADTLALEQVYGPFLAFSDTSSLMAPGLASDIRSGGNAAVDRLQNRLSNVRSNMTGPLLKQTQGQIQRAWAADVAALRDALGKLLDQPFMKPIPGKQTLRATIPPGRRLRWNDRELQQIVRHIQVYDSVTTKGLSKFPPSMRQTVRQVAAAGLSSHLTQHLGRAQSYALSVSRGSVSRLEVQLQRRADRFRKALTPLNTALTIQGELNMDTARRKLARVTAQDAYALLKSVDNLLMAQNLYGVGESAFEQWQGRRSPNLAVVNARDSQEVKRYLKLQREQMTFLAQEVAGPALSFLAKWEGKLQVADRELVSKWQGIRQALRRHQNKTAGNALSILEDFFTSEMSGVHPVSYFLQTPASRVSQQSSNFFLQKRNLLRRKLYRRSRELALQRTRQRYRRLASFFNQQLGGRFPFAALADSGAVRGAPPSDVRRFYRRYDRYMSTYRPVWRQAGMTTGPAWRFLGRIEKLRPFFGAFLDRPSTYPVPTVDVVPIFRVNRDREVLGDQVIGWHMRVGGERASYGRSDTLHWAAGDRVVVRLRWASDAPTRPVEATRATVDASARTVTYRYGGQWALLRLLRRHAAPPRRFDRRVDPDPHTLQFTAQVKGSEGPSQARVFIRQHLYRPDESVRIILSAPFPRQAPPLPDTTQTLSRGRP